MKAVHVLPLVLLFGCSKCQPVPYPSSIRGNSSVDTAYVFLDGGQSNANTQGIDISAQYTADATKVNSWDTTNKNFTHYGSLASVDKGFHVESAALYAEAHGLDSVYVIKPAKGSLGISNWYDAGGVMRLWDSSAIIQAFAHLRTRGFYVKVVSSIWLQGEQDCTAGTSPATYQAKLDSVIARRRRLDPALTNTPFVIVKLMEGSGGGTYVTSAVDLNAAYTNLASLRSNVVVIRPEDLGCTLSDTVHYTISSFILIANAWFDLFP